jgi:hypothetical protein
MNTLASMDLSAQTIAIPNETGRRLRTQAQLLGAVIGLAGGTLAALIGSLLTGISWFVPNAAAQHWLAIAGAALLFMTIPLLILGAYCLDWREKDKQQRYSKVVRFGDDDEGER